MPASYNRLMSRSIILLATFAWSVLTVRPATARVNCFRSRQPIASVHCYAPDAVTSAENGLAFQAIEPGAAVRTVTRLSLTQVVTVETEAASGGQPLRYVIVYVYGTVPQGKQGLLIPGGRASRYVTVTEMLSNQSVSAGPVVHGNGGLDLFRTRPTKRRPWMSSIRVSNKVVLFVTSNLTRRAVARIVTRLER